MHIEVKVAFMPHAVPVLPAYGSDGAAGFDIASSEDAFVYGRQHRIVHTGLRFEVPPGFELQIRSRSGMAANNTIFVLNSPGTLDCDYRGELMIILMNLGDSDFRVTRGMRIAQAVLSPVIRATLIGVAEEELAPTRRGDGRFGSTGA
jgi:dUTP pyrophosphatase